MPGNMENLAVATGLEKVSFHSIPKERQCQKMFKLPNNCFHFTCCQGNAQNPSSQASAVHEPKMYTLDIENEEELEVNLSNICWIIEKEN